MIPIPEFLFLNMKKWVKEFAFITKSLELLCIPKCLKMLFERRIRFVFCLLLKVTGLTTDTLVLILLTSLLF